MSLGSEGGGGVVQSTHAIFFCYYFYRLTVSVAESGVLIESKVTMIWKNYSFMWTKPLVVAWLELTRRGGLQCATFSVMF